MIKLLVEVLVWLIDRMYGDRPYSRFYVLETVARVPYFSFLSVLHLYESLGWWRKCDWLKVHFAQAWNEMHHLMIMEELGGNCFWGDRLFAQVTTLIYYWILVGLYFISPRKAYYFMQLVEEHAYESYDSFLKTHEAELKSLPVPIAAQQYYQDGDLYLFDAFQTSQTSSSRRPVIHNLYDVFVNIRDDEGEHLKTMTVCQTFRGLTEWKNSLAASQASTLEELFTKTPKQ